MHSQTVDDSQRYLAMSGKYEYKVVRIAATKDSIGKAKKKPEGDAAYENVINQHAAEGWRLSALWSPPGVATVWLDIVLEREAV